MRNTPDRFASLARTAAVAGIALALATPAAAQFGGLKKKLKSAAGQEGASKAAGAPAPGDAGGTIVLTEDVVKQLLAGLRAGRDERAAAEKEDTPYGRYKRAQAAYAEAQPKCQAGQQTFGQRAAADEKMMNKYSALADKTIAAQQKGDQQLAAVYADSAMAMQDPACTVKQPTQPDNYYEAQRDIDTRAEKAEIKASGLSQGELAMAKERADAILRGGTPPGDVSPSEKSVVSTHASELKSLLGIQDQTTVRVSQPTPAPAPTPAPPPGATAAPAGSSAMSACMAENAQKHQQEIEALGRRAEAAQKAGDTATMMAIADSLQQLQMAGCMGAR